VKKEFGFAGDIVEAVWLLVNQENVFEAIIGSGKSYSIREWVKYCFKKINLNYNDYIIIQNEFFPEYEMLLSNPSIMMGLGWKPKFDFFQLADMMMDNK
jgi:GDPmannose 4,6-dehydratase